MKILYFDMDNVLVDFQSAFKHLSEDTLKEYEGRLDEVPGHPFIKNMRYITSRSKRTRSHWMPSLS